jgi:hypothetical protein
MTDGVQPGVRIDPVLWEEFREFVKSKNGAVRGHLQTEVETALRNHIHHGSEQSVGQQLTELNERMYRMEQSIGTVGTDGGDTVSPDPHTHAPSRLDVSEKPASNCATEKKLTYLAGCVKSEYGIAADKPCMIPRSELATVVKSEYGFRRDTAKRYVEQLIDHFDLRDHPNPQFDQLVSEPKYRDLVDEQLETDP